MESFIKGGTMWDSGTTIRTIDKPILYNLVGKYKVLSPDYPLESIRVPFVDTRCNRRANSVEQAFYACKTPYIVERTRILSDDVCTMRDSINSTTTSFNWYANRLAIMNELVRLRFGNDYHASRLLKGTEPSYIMPGNMGLYWGVNLENGCLVGTNHYGEILMGLRDDLLDVPYSVSYDKQVFL